MEEFMKDYNLKNLLNGPTCFRNPDQAFLWRFLWRSLIKVFRHPRLLYSQYLTGISDFHKMVMAVLKVYFKKKGPSVTQYRDYKNLSNQT